MRSRSPSSRSVCARSPWRQSSARDRHRPRLRFRVQPARSPSGRIPRRPRCPPSRSPCLPSPVRGPSSNSVWKSSGAARRGSSAALRPDPTGAIRAPRSSRCRAGTGRSRGWRSPWPAGTRASRESRARRPVEDAGVRLQARSRPVASSSRCRSRRPTADGRACSPARRGGGSLRVPSGCRAASDRRPAYGWHRPVAESARPRPRSARGSRSLRWESAAASSTSARSASTTADGCGRAPPPRGAGRSTTRQRCRSVGCAIRGTRAASVARGPRPPTSRYRRRGRSPAGGAGRNRAASGSRCLTASGSSD